MKLLLTTLLLAIAPVASAETLHFTWTKPANIATNPVSGYNIYQGASAAEATAKTNKIVDGGPLNSPDVLSYDITISAPGTYYFAMDSWFCDASGCAVSAATPAVAYTVAAPAPVTPPATTPPTPTPAPPANLTIVTVATIAYDLQKSANKYALVSIGTVPLGIACKTGMDAMGMHVIADRTKAVIKAGTARPQAVLAKCG